MALNTESQIGFNPEDCPYIEGVFQMVSKVVADSAENKSTERALILQLASALSHLTYKVSELEDKLP